MRREKLDSVEEIFDSLEGGESLPVEIKATEPSAEVIIPDKPLTQRRTFWWVLLGIIPQIPAIIDQYGPMIPTKYQKYANAVSMICLGIASLYARQTAVDRTKK